MEETAATGGRYAEDGGPARVIVRPSNLFHCRACEPPARVARSSVSTLFALCGALLLLLAPCEGLAIEAFDGRVQAHGFVETQVRVISKGFNDQFDLTQWYNIINLELEFDIAPNGFGPFDMVNAFVRAEARFDCVWSRACGIAPMATAFGDRSGNTEAALSGSLPERLSNAVSQPATGQIITGPIEIQSNLIYLVDPTASDADDAFLAIPVRAPVGLDSVPVFDFFSTQPGPDQAFGTGDEPFPYLFQGFLDFRFANIKVKGGGSSGLSKETLGPWLPKNAITPIAALGDRVNPFDSSIIFPFTLDPSAPPGDPTKNVRGSGARPFRPIPVVAPGLAGVPDPTPRGVFYPARPLQGELASRRLDSLQLNYDQSELQWNRGASQTTKELKEAYLDLEMFDNRLWLRVGKQVIVWGKTELFRNMDQFNPIDLALSSLPSLEESRISLNAVRGVWSFYDVGPLEDVRAEIAFIFDRYIQNDIGRCGEPYTANPVCVTQYGGFTDGTLAIGLVGFERPDDPWQDITDTEFGARLEWRWGRASFAISDFYGYPDLPYADQIVTYERNVDPATGRPRTYSSRASCNWALMGFSFGGDAAGCLSPGPTDRTNPASVALADVPGNALLYHPANQQIFAAICAATVGSSLDPSACALTLFNSNSGAIPLSPLIGQFLAGTNLNVPVLTPGVPQNDPSPFVQLGIQQFDGGTAPRQSNPPLPGRQFGAQGCLDPGGVPCGFGFGGVNNGGTSLGNRLSKEQEALLGCGPFFGVNCDASGLDFLNAEGSALLQSFVGIEGTYRGWRTDDATIAQPGTICFLNRAPQPGEVCPDFVMLGGMPTTTPVQFVRGGPICTTTDIGGAIGQLLPGCRSAGDPASGIPPDPGYNATVDGATALVRWPANPATRVMALEILCNAARDATGNCPTVLPALPRVGRAGGPTPAYFPGLDVGLAVRGAHPFTGQRWKSELSALSWNLMMLLVTISPEFTQQHAADGNDVFAFLPGHCGYVQPQFCSNVSAIMFVGIAKRNVVLAGGDARYGRRTFAWHAGGQAVARFQRQNILGFGADFAEDVTKSNWGIEFSWVNDARFTDRDVISGVTRSDTLNLTISVDRPTFVNFLNANRTFFFNMQWFLGYIPGYEAGFTSTGPFNALGTLTASTAYFQDRLSSALTLVLDTRSLTGAVLPSVTYRITSNFSLSLGMAVFLGAPDQLDIAVRGLLPGTNYIGPDPYSNQVDRGLSVITDRDEVYMRMRYTF